MYEKFQELLQTSGKTAYQVSKDTGISTATLTEWKKGTYKPKIEKLMVIASYFGVPIEYFLTDMLENRKEEKDGEKDEGAVNYKM